MDYVPDGYSLAEVRAIYADAEATTVRLTGAARKAARQKLATTGILSLDFAERRLLNIQEHEFEAADKAARAEALRRTVITDALRPRGIVFRSSLVERLCDHAIALVLKHDLHVRRQHDGNGEAHIEQRTICVPPVTNERNYSLVLHEVAHIADVESDSRQHDYAIRNSTMSAPDAETNAWNWAVRHSYVWTNSMQACLFDGLLSYAGGATVEQRDRMANFVADAAFQIRDKSWTAEEFTDKCAQLRADPVLHTKTAVAASAETIAALEQRVRELESRPSMQYCGVWDATRTYGAGDAVTKNGSVWIAKLHHLRSQPGVDFVGWQLAVKKGADGRDAVR